MTPRSSLTLSHPRNGLTMLETLIASALLAVLAAATLPLIVRSLAVLGARSNSPSPDVTLADLSALADEFLEQPMRFGLANASLHTVDSIEINWPATFLKGLEHTGMPLPPVLVRSSRSADSDADHLWLRFECGGFAVRRWVALPKDTRTVVREQSR